MRLCHGPAGIKDGALGAKHRPLLTSIVLASASYLIRNPMAPICNSNENQTPAPSTLAPGSAHLRRSNPGKKTQARGRAEERKGGVGDGYWRRVFPYWKIRW